MWRVTENFIDECTLMGNFMIQFKLNKDGKILENLTRSGGGCDEKTNYRVLCDNRGQKTNKENIAHYARNRNSFRNSNRNTGSGTKICT